VNDVKRKGPSYSIYKPLPKADSGAAIQFKWAGGSVNSLFVEAARQKGPRLPMGDKNQFDWSPDNKISFKLNLTDIGKLLLVVLGKTKEADLIHRTERDVEGVTIERQSTFKLEKQTKTSAGSGYDNYKLRMTKVETIDGNKGDLVNVQIYINHDEMAILSILLRKAAENMLGV
jgi:hypothetical protein